MSLRLHESSHDPKAGVELSIGGVGGHARYDGVVGTLPRGEAVGMVRIKREISTSILLHKVKETQLTYYMILNVLTCIKTPYAHN